MNGQRKGQGIIVMALMALGLALALLASGRADPRTKDAVDKPVSKPSPERTLRSPETPARYADIDLPAHFKTAANA